MACSTDKRKSKRHRTSRFLFPGYVVMFIQRPEGLQREVISFLFGAKRSGRCDDMRPWLLEIIKS